MDGVGLVVVLVFYALITVLGVWVARRWRWAGGGQEDFMLAGRNLGLVVGICTLVATEVGGAFVNGTTEEVFRTGFLWCLAPIGYSLSMTVNGFFFVDKLRDKNFLTLIDALQDAYGDVVGGIVYLPSCIGDVCWTAAVLTSLGSTLQVILDIDSRITIIISAFIAVLYTLFGGMRSVAYTDVLQLLFIFVGLWLAVPFVLTDEDVDVASASSTDWTGKIPPTSIVTYIDSFILILFGGIPWQPYYQRALSLRTNGEVKILSVAATLICFVCIVPPVILGVAAKTVDWADSSIPGVMNDSTVALPAIIHEASPYSIQLICLAAISAAVMSSVDSSLLAGASYIAHNLFAQESTITVLKLLLDLRNFLLLSLTQSLMVFSSLRSDKEPHYNSSGVLWVVRLSIVVLGVLAVVLSLFTSTIYGLWVLAGDLGYVVVFPQFLCAVHLRDHVNVFGSAAGAIVGSVLRILVGEPSLDFGATIVTPKFEDGSEMLPVKTLIMLTSLATLIVVSRLATMQIRRRGHVV